MEDLIYVFVGLVMMYGLAHFYTIQFTKTWSERNVYEKILTVGSAVIMILILIGSAA